jgi:hypothetical protein
MAQVPQQEDFKLQPLVIFKAAYINLHGGTARNYA